MKVTKSYRRISFEFEKFEVYFSLLKLKDTGIGLIWDACYWDRYIDLYLLWFVVGVNKT